MKENYTYKIYSDESKFAQIGNRIQLREYQDNLVFYHPCSDTKAEYGFGDRSGIFIKSPEIYDHGKFATCLKIKSPIKYDYNIFEGLNEKGRISFFTGVNVLNGKCSQDILSSSWPAEGLPAGEYSFNIKCGDELPRAVVFDLDEGNTFSDFTSLMYFNIDPSIYYVDFDIKNNNARFVGSFPGKMVEISDGTEGNNLLDYVGVSPKRLSSYPSKDVEIFSLKNNDNNNSKISFKHVKDGSIGKIICELYDNDGVLKTTLKTDFVNDGVTLNNIELDFNDELAYLFLDGQMMDVRKTGFTRKNNSTYLVIQGIEDSSSISEDGAAYTFDEIIIKSECEHTESFTPSDYALTRYSIERPFIDFFFKGGEIKDNIQLDISASPNTHYILYHNDYAYYYHQGSWRTSDGTYNQSNDQYTFVQYIPTFPFDGSDFTIRVIFDSDGYEPSYVDFMYFTSSETEITNEEGDSAAVLVGDPRIDDTVPVGGKTLIIKTDQGETEITFNKQEVENEDMDYPYDSSRILEIIKDIVRETEKIEFPKQDDTVYSVEDFFKALKENCGSSEITLTLNDKEFKYNVDEYLDLLNKAINSLDDFTLPARYIGDDDGNDDDVYVSLSNSFTADDLIEALKDRLPEFINLEEPEKSGDETVLSDNLTLQDIIKEIKEAFPEGISAVGGDTTNRIYLVSTTLGDEAFIRVSGDAAPYIFGGNVSANGKDASHDTVDYSKFKESVKSYFGYPLIPWDITDEQLDLFVKEASNLYNRYRNDDIHTVTQKLKGNCVDGYKIPSVVGDRRNIVDIVFKPIFPLTFYGSDLVGDGSGDNIMSLVLAKSLFGGNSGTFMNGFTLDYYIANMSIQDMKQTLGINPTWEILNDRLYIYPNNVARYTDVCIKYKAAVDPQIAMNDPEYIKMVAGMCMMMSGKIKQQYGGTLSTASNVAALTFNGDTLYQNGKTAYDEALASLKGMQEPLGFFMG